MVARGEARRAYVSQSVSQSVASTLKAGWSITLVAGIFVPGLLCIYWMHHAARVEQSARIRKLEAANITAVAEQSAYLAPTIAPRLSPENVTTSYVRRVGELEAEKQEVERRLSEAQEGLEKAREHAALSNGKYDLDQDAWKELAKTGTVKFLVPCNNFSPSESDVAALGLSDDDSNAIGEIFKEANAEAQAELRTACASIAGAEVVANFDLPTCVRTMFLDMKNRDETSLKRAMWTVSDYRAGNQAQIPDELRENPVVKSFLALTRASKQAEQKIAEKLGPDIAKRVVYGLHGCSSSMDIGGPGPRPVGF